MFSKSVTTTDRDTILYFSIKLYSVLDVLKKNQSLFKIMSS